MITFSHSYEHTRDINVNWDRFSFCSNGLMTLSLIGNNKFINVIVKHLYMTVKNQIPKPTVSATTKII